MFDRRLCIASHPTYDSDIHAHNKYKSLHVADASIIFANESENRGILPWDPRSTRPRVHEMVYVYVYED